MYKWRVVAIYHKGLRMKPQITLLPAADPQTTSSHCTSQIMSSRSPRLNKLPILITNRFTPSTTIDQHYEINPSSEFTIITEVHYPRRALNVCLSPANLQANCRELPLQPLSPRFK